MTKPPNPQRRSQRSHDAILAAALELCAEEGCGRVTIEGIAARAGVSKKTIYRWWPSKGAVVLEALHEAADIAAPHPDTGDLATDMRTQLAAVIGFLSPPSRAPLTGLIADALGDPELAAPVRERLIRPRIEEFVQRMRRAQMARKAAGLPDGFTFYDLRHTGHTLSTQSGATLKDTMVRAGQSSEKAAMIYPHSNLERQREVADGIHARVQALRAKASGTDLAREP